MSVGASHQIGRSGKAGEVNQQQDFEAMLRQQIKQEQRLQREVKDQQFALDLTNKDAQKSKLDKPKSNCKAGNKPNSKSQKPEKPQKPDFQKMAKEMADKMGNGNDKLDTDKEKSDYKNILAMLEGKFEQQSGSGQQNAPAQAPALSDYQAPVMA